MLSVCVAEIHLSAASSASLEYVKVNPDVGTLKTPG